MATKIICVLNFKGGTAKTTTVASVGSALARKGHRTLLVDLDSQANLSECFGFEYDSSKPRTIFDAVVDGTGLPIYKENDNLFFVPSDMRLANIEQKIAADKDRSTRLRRLLEAAAAKEVFDFIIIDCPPAFGVGSTSALVASDYAIIPMEPTALPFSGMQKMKAYADLARTKNPKLDLLGIVFVRYRGTRNNRDIIARVNEEYPGLPFNTVIRENTTVAEAAGAKWDIIEYDPKSHGALDYMALTEELLHKIDNQNEKRIS